MAQPTGISIHPETGNVGIGVVNASSKLQVNGHITPSSCNVFDLGSSQLRFRDLYLSGSTIDLGGTKISRDENSGGITLASASGETVDSRVKNLFADGTITASNLNIVGDYVTMRTTTSNTEMMVIENAGTGPALKVTQTGANSIAEFYDDGGVLALKIADGGNVGIGVTNPMSRLVVSGASSFQGNTTIGNDSVANQHSLQGYMYHTYNGSETALVVNQKGTGKILELQDFSVPVLTILDGGNIGIGTANPQAKLDVQGDVNITGPVALVMGATGIKTYMIKEYNSSASSRWWLLATLSNSNTNLLNMNGNFSRVDDYYYISLKINANNTRVPIISSSQHVGNMIYVSKCQIYRNTSTEVLDVWINVPSFTIANMIFESNGTINTVASWTVTSPVVSATYVLLHDTSINANQTVTSTGNVGIGTTIPLAKLHVNGTLSCTNIQATGYISAPNSILQMLTTSVMPTSHLAVASTTAVAAPLSISITPNFANSKIKVDFWSSMAYGGGGGAIVTILQRSINGGAYTELTPVSGGSSRYTYGWSYNTNNWSSWTMVYYDTPNTTLSVTYRILYKNMSGTAVNYLVHQYMEYGWFLSEIKV